MKLLCGPACLSPYLHSKLSNPKIFWTPWNPLKVSCLSTSTFTRWIKVSPFLWSLNKYLLSGWQGYFLLNSHPEIWVQCQQYNGHSINVCLMNASTTLTLTDAPLRQRCLSVIFLPSPTFRLLLLDLESFLHRLQAEYLSYFLPYFLVHISLIPHDLSKRLHPIQLCMPDNNYDVWYIEHITYLQKRKEEKMQMICLCEGESEKHQHVNVTHFTHCLENSFERKTNFGSKTQSNRNHTGKRAVDLRIRAMAGETGRRGKEERRRKSPKWFQNQVYHCLHYLCSQILITYGMHVLEIFTMVTHYLLRTSVFLFSLLCLSVKMFGSLSITLALIKPFPM